ncbi:hypothetical protein, partial [Nostoc sp.]|uniref:hypothetical protein n=1 Tax=Nostoc sp. TaxID=1180 RepID=UPI002FEEC123
LSISCCAPSCHLCLFLNPTYIYVSRLFCTTKVGNLQKLRYRLLNVNLAIAGQLFSQICRRPYPH